VGGGAVPYHPLRSSPADPESPMSKKKDCLGSETYVCRTTNCAYMSECVKVVWEKKLRRILARRPASAAAPTALTRTAGGVTMRARDFLPAHDARG
jgi:hypothetical protein